MSNAKGIKIPVNADVVSRPHICYGGDIFDEREQTGIYFRTVDAAHGRITFDKLDALKIYRGEELPYDYDWEDECWVFKVEDSSWLAERFAYENEHYGNAYEFSGDVKEMQSDFNHYVFKFHDEFVEVIARGIWYEKDQEPLLGKPLKLGHSLLDLSEEKATKFTAYSLSCQIRKTSKSQCELMEDTKICPQKIMQFTLELSEKATPNLSLIALYRNNKLISVLSKAWGGEIAHFEGIACLKEVQPYVDSYIQEVSCRRKEQSK